LDETGAPLTKKALKRQVKSWIFQKVRRQQRANNKQQKKRSRAEFESEQGDNPSMLPHAKKRTRILRGKQLRDFVSKKLSNALVAPPRVVLDCRFEKMMAEKDIRGLANQVSQLYGQNMRANNPVRLIATSFGGKLKANLEKNQKNRFDVWLLETFEKPLEEVFTQENKEHEKVVYLTSDSPNDLETLESDKIYVIGALVDHNRHKCCTFDLAAKQQWKTAKLPILNHMKRIDGSGQRVVITVNQVSDILVAYWNWKDWRKAFHFAIPKRREFQLINPLSPDEISQLKFDGNVVDLPYTEKHDKKTVPDSTFEKRNAVEDKE